MTEEFVERGKIDIGRVLQQTFGVIGRNLATFTLLGLILSGLPLAVVTFAQARWARGAFDQIEAGSFGFSTGQISSVSLGYLGA